MRSTLSPYLGMAGVYLGRCDNAVMGLQPDWRWCDRCYTLAYSGFGTGACRAGGGHVFDATGAYLVMMTDEPAGTQNGWRWCANCQSLAYGGFSGGTCFAAGEHDFTGSGEYSVPLGGTPVGAQAGWRWCSRCQCLVYGGDPTGSGFCPAGGGHDLSGSSAYSVATPTTAAADPLGRRTRSVTPVPSGSHRAVVGVSTVHGTVIVPRQPPCRSPDLSTVNARRDDIGGTRATG